MAGVASRAAARKNLTLGILYLPYPAGHRIGAEVINHIHLAECMTRIVNQSVSTALPLVVLRAEEVPGLGLVALETGLCSFEMRKAAGVCRRIGRHRTGGRETTRP